MIPAEDMSEKIRKLIHIIGAVIILIGICGLCYPTVGNYINSFQHRNVIKGYKGNVNTIGEDLINSILQAAEGYNERLWERSRTIDILDEEQYAEYNSMLRVDGSDIMGYINIPKIKVELPIYHGTSDAVLQAGIGHLEGSSLPIGGSDTHTILTGHSGLPSIRLFTDLDQLENGDTFTITVLNRTLTYEVDGSKIVLPESANFTIEEGADECTLVTCTPIGVNTHRLLVHSHRVPDVDLSTVEEKKEREDGNSGEPAEQRNLQESNNTGIGRDSTQYSIVIITVGAILIAFASILGLVQFRKKKKGE